MRRVAFYCTNLAADLLAISAAFAIPYLFGLSTALDEITVSMFAALCVLYLGFVSKSMNARIISDWRTGIGPAVMALCTSAAIVLALAFALKTSATISRLYAGIAFGQCILGFVLVRATVARLSKHYFDGSPFSAMVIVDDCDLPAFPGAECRAAAELGLDGSLGNPLILDRLARSVRGFDRILVASSDERRSAWATALRASAVRADMLMPELDRFGALGCERFAGVPLVAISEGQMPVRDDLLKRVFDIVVSLAALIFFAPLLLLTALAIRIETPGPIFFTQERVGRGNRIFRVLKFRSMYLKACDAKGDVSTARNDRRVTRVGRFMRATSIDELPQLINVLRGEMSIVGPRPHALGSQAGDQLFWEIDPAYHHRHVSKPGLTGLAQIRGFRGATEKREDLVNRLAADLEYTHNWSIWRDIEIVCATLLVFVHRNAF